MPSIPHVKQQKQGLIRRYAQADNVKGLAASLGTLIPMALLWWAIAWGSSVSIGLTLVAAALMTFCLVRAIVLMHECGHGSQFSTPWLNQAFGFLFGVTIGMPQYVWSKHHSFHHAHNGNWDAYRGPLTTSSTDEYAALSASGQRSYRLLRNMAMLPLGGVLYLIVNPRLNWLKGTVGLLVHLGKGLRTQPGVPLRALAATYRSPYWQSAKEHRHMLANNLVLLSLWALMSAIMGPAWFFAVYLATLSLAGGAGIALFAIQHNFEHSYASDEARWDHVRGAVSGTSYLVLPRWLNWVTANCGYHHVHHLSARIPSYRLAECHRDNEALFADVPRVTLSQIPMALKCILWDIGAERIISVSEYQEQLASMPA